MKKVTIIPGITLSYDGQCLEVYPVMGVTTAAGAEAFTEASRSVVTILWSIIYGRFYEKIRG